MPVKLQQIKALPTMLSFQEIVENQHSSHH